MTDAKLPSVEDFVEDLLRLDGPERKLHVTAAIHARDRAVLEVAAELAELFVPTALSTQTHGERIGERIRKLADEVAPDLPEPEVLRPKK